MGERQSFPIQLSLCAAMTAVGIISDVMGSGELSDHGDHATTLAHMGLKGAAFLGAGVAGNILHEWLKRGHDQIVKPRRKPEDLLHNHDIQALAGRATGILILIESNEYKGSPEGQRYLKRLAAQVPKDWQQHAADPAFSAISGGPIRELIKGSASKSPGRVTVELWEKLLGELETATTGEEALALKSCAQRLWEDFGAAVFELLKEDFAPGENDSPHKGKAFAAAHMLLIRECISGIEEVATLQEAALEDQKEFRRELKHELTELHRMLEKRCSAILAAATADTRKSIEPIAADVRRISGYLAEGFGLVLDSLSDLHTTVNRIAVGVEVLQSGHKLAFVRQDSHDIPEALAAEYRKRLKEMTGYIDLVVPAGSTRRVEIENLATDLPLRVVQLAPVRREKLSNAELVEQQRENQKKDRQPELPKGTFDIETRLGGSDLIVIRGLSGSGKSTLFAQLVHKKLREEGGPLPAVIRCRDLKPMRHGAGLEELFEEQLQQWAFGANERRRLAEGILERLLAEGGMILIDGLDELATEACQEGLLRMLPAWLAREKVQVVLTSRPTALEVLADQLAAFEILEIAPLSYQDKARYIEKWKALSPETTFSILEERLHERPLESLCENAHCLALATQAYVAGRSLPERETDLFEQLVDLMIKHQRDGRNQRPRLDRNEVFAHLEAAGYAMAARNSMGLTDDKVIEHFAELRQVEKDIPSLMRRTPDQLLEDIIQRLRILVKAKDLKDNRGVMRQEIQFLHQSWQSYFAALAIVHCRTGSRLSAEEKVREILRNRGQDTEVSAKTAAAWLDVFGLVLELASVNDNGEESAIVQVIAEETDPEHPGGRDRAVFVLERLISERDLAQTTAQTVLLKGLGTLAHKDAETAASISSRIADTRWRERLEESMLQLFVSTPGAARYALGLAYLDSFAITEREAEGIESQLEAKVARAHSPTEQAGALLDLVEHYYQLTTRGGGVDQDKNAGVRAQLIALAREGNESAQFAAMWALSWLVHSSSDKADAHKAWFTAEETAVLRAVILDDSWQDELVGSFAAVLATSRAGAGRLREHTDWTYSIALIADAASLQRNFKAPAPALFDPELAEALLRRLGSIRDPLAAGRLSLALGRIGTFDETMVDRLIGYLQAKPMPSQELREEAILWLIHIGGHVTASKLRDLLGKLESDDEWLETRLMFAIIAIGDFEVLVEELHKGAAAAGSFVTEYAAALAGLSDPRGAEAIRAAAQDPDRDVRRAAQAARKKILREGDEELEQELGSALTAAANVIAQKTVCILLVRGENTDGGKIYAYVAIRADRLEEFMKAQEKGTFYPEDFGIIIESGEGQPSQEVREKMTKEYGFNHEQMLDIKDGDSARGISSNISKFNKPPETTD